MKAIYLFLIAGFSGLALAAPIQSDSFSGTVIDSAKWQLPPHTYGNAALSQNNGLYYHNNGNGTSEDEINLYATGVASVTSDWTVRFDAHVPDLAKINTPGQSVGLEMKIWNSADDSDRADIQTSIVRAPDPYGKIRTLGADITNDYWVSDPAPGGSTGVFQNLATQSRITLAFSWKASTSTLSAWYAPAGDATDWIRLTSWNLGVGSPTEWSLGPAASFMFYISGSSADLDLLPADNVRITDFVVSGSALSGRIPPTITTGDNPSRPDFIPLLGTSEGTPYSTTIGATGGVLPHAWSMVIGSLPPGLILDSATGSIQGTPTLTGSYPFRVRVTGADGGYAEGSYSIEVGADPFVGNHSPSLFTSHDNIRNFSGALNHTPGGTFAVVKNDPTHYTVSFQPMTNLERFGNRLQNTVRPLPNADGNPLDLIMLSDGGNRAFVQVTQEVSDPDDISFGVASWTSHVGNVTASEWAGTWSFDTYGDSNLRDYANGFDHDLFPAIQIQQVDADHIQIILPSGGALPLLVSGNSAFLDTSPLVVGTIRYHEFHLQGDGQSMSMHSVASEIDDLTDVSVTIGLGEKAVSPPPPYTYTTANGQVTITGYNGPGGAVTIPSLIDGLPVTVIGEDAFYDEDGVTSVTIPVGVTSIGSSAFAYCTSLTSVTIPASVASIGSFAFGYCTSLTAISVDGLNAAYSSLDGVLFNKSQTTLIQFPAGRTGTYNIPVTVTSIGNYAFYYSDLTSVTIPNGVTSIGYDAFHGCTNLTSVTIPASVASIGSFAFGYCTSLTAISVDGLNSAYSSLDGVLFNKSQTTLIQYPAGKAGSYAIPGTVTSIANSAFSYSDLTSVTIPASVTSIAAGAFEGCTSLTAILVDGLNSAYSSLDGVLFNKSQTSLIRYPVGKTGSYTIPASVTSIEELAFYGCNSLTSVTVPPGVTSISPWMFESCTSLTAIAVDPLNAAFSSLEGVLFNKNQSTLIRFPEGKAGSYTIPNSVTRIAEGAFYGCSALTSVTIPASVTSIAAGAFYDCSGLMSVTIAAGVTSIGDWAFYGCYSLVEAIFLGHAPSLLEADWGIFETGNDEFTVYFYEGKSGFTEPTWMGYPSASLGLFPGPDIAVEQPADTNLADGEARDFGAVAVGESASLSFTIRNTGAEELTGLALALDGPDSGVFSFIPLASSTLASGASTTFSVTFTPTAAPPAIAALHIASNDADQNPFDIRLSGNFTVADAIDQPGVSITDGGDAPWFAQTPTTHDGVDAAQSGPISDSEEDVGDVQESWMQTALTGPGTLTLWWKVSSEEDFDFLELYLDGNLQESISGEIDWQQLAVTIPAGVHTVQLRYSKDDSVSSGRDAGWVDEVVFIPEVLPTYDYIPNDDGTITITGYNGSGGNVSIPESIDGLLVTMIDDDAFSGDSSLTKITIPEGVTYIGDSAFADCDNLASVSIPASVTVIGYGAFAYCDNLSAITVDPNNAAYSSVDGVLFDKDQTILIQCPSGKAGSYIIPGSVTDIGDSAFLGCEDLTGLTLPDGLAYIGDDAFGWCEELADLTIPASVTYIGNGAFYGCRELVEVIIPNGVTRIGYETFSGCTGLTSVTIPASVTSIGWRAFSQCSGLTSVIIPAGVTYIEYGTFEGCNSLTSVTIPDGVISIEDHAFDSCSSLKNITIPDSVTAIGGWAFASCASLTRVTIPASVTWIGEYENNRSAMLAISASVTGIGIEIIRTFDSCTKLTAITVDPLNANYCSVDGVLFDKDQTALIQYPAGKAGSYTIPASVTRIKGGAFASCGKLTGVTIPAAVTSIGFEAFDSCGSLNAITVGAGNPAYVSVAGVLFNHSQTTLIQYPAGKPGSYVVPSSVTNIQSRAFASCTGLTSVTIPNSVTSMGSEVFFGCTSLTSATLSNSLTNIGYRTFAACRALTGISIPNNVTYVEDEAFFACTSLAGVTLGNSLQHIGDRAFAKCPGLTSLNIPASVTEIDFGAFAECPGLTSVTIPANVTVISGEVFGGCSGLTSVTIPSGVTSIGDNAFHGCSGLTSITIPPGVTYIGYEAFSDCSGLTSVTIPPWVTVISESAFEECSGLTSVSIPAGVTRIGEDAFSDCSGLTSVTIPEGVTQIGDGAFYECAGLTTVNIPASVSFLHEEAFRICTGLTSITVDPANPSYSSVDGVLFDKLQTTLIQYPAGRSGAYTIPASVTRVCDMAFVGSNEITAIAVQAGNTNFTSMDGVLFNQSQTTLLQYPGGRNGAYTIPAGVTDIRMGAFALCNGLTDVTLPASVSHIGQYTFYGSAALSSIAVDPANPNFSSASGILYNKPQTTLRAYPPGRAGVATIPSGVTHIGVTAFGHCSALTSVILPAGLTEIGEEAFEECAALTSVALPASLRRIGGDAFNGCSSLTGITLPAGLIRIGDDAFADCHGLTSVTIPSSVTRIGDSAFEDSRSLSSVTFMGNAPATDWEPFGGNASAFMVYFYDGKTGFTTPFWKDSPAESLGLYPGPQIALEQPADLALSDDGAIDFGMVDVGQTASRILTIRNTGGQNLTGLAISLDGTNSGEFTVSPPGATTLASGASTTFSVTFTPTATDTRVAAIHIASNDTEQNPFDVNLTGNGIVVYEIVVEQPSGTALLDGGSRDFGTVVAGSNNSLDFTIRNTGTVDLTGLTVDMDGPNAEEFTVTTLAAGTLAVGESTTFNITFSPSVTGTRRAAIHITSNEGSANPYDITLTGNCGTAIAKYSFETDEGWDLTEYDTQGNLSGGYSTEWASDGSSCYRIQRSPGSMDNGWIQITKSGVDLTGVSGVVFDCSDTGIDRLEIQFMIDGVKVASWSNNGWPGGVGDDWGNTAETLDIVMAFPQTYVGVHEIAIRVQDGGPYLPADAKIYRIDNVRFTSTDAFPAGVVSWWTGDDTANDSIGTNHGVLVNGATYAAGRYGKAFSFDGINDFVEVANAPSLNFPPNSTGTFEFWFLQTAQNFPVHFLGKRIEAFTNSMNYQVAFGWERPGNPFPTGVWTHLAMVYDTTGISIYVNGALFASYPGATFLPTNTVPLRLGTSDSLHEYGQSFAGLMDNIRIYNRALTLAEVQAIANSVPTTLPFTYTIANGEVIITGYTGAGGHVVIPGMIDGMPVTSIGSSAFSGKSSITSITIPDSVTGIGVSAFADCTGLTSMTIPANVTSIWHDAFSACAQLLTIYVDAANPNYSSLDGVLFDKGQATVVKYPEARVGPYNIPTSVKSIGLGAFFSSTKLTSVTIPTSVTSIGRSAFLSCTGLTSVSIPASVTSIGITAFKSCTGLSGALFMGNAPTLGSDLFGVNVFSGTAAGFKVYFLSGATGFTTPTWYGYPTVNIGLLLGNYDYRITTGFYAPEDDWNLAVKQEFGPNAEVVDWNTLKNDFGGSVESIRGLFDYLGILPYPDGDAPAVTRDGSQIWSGSRSYGVNRLEGNVPGGYLVHDQIQNNWVCLGSWPADRRIIARVPLTQASGPDLMVSASAPLAAVRGVNFDYTITVTNQGLSGANGISVRFTLPANLNYVSAQTWSGGSPVVASGGMVDFPGGTLAAGASVTLTLTAAPTAAGVLTVPIRGVVVDPANAIVEADEGNNGNPMAVVTEVRAPSDAATLADLALSSGTLRPAFAADTTDYTVTVPNAVASLTVTPVVADAGMTVTVNGTAVASGSASLPIALEVGETRISTVVTAEDGIATRIYRITVTRLEPMVVTTESASGLTPISALLRGTVNPRDSATVFFEYGPTTAYGFITDDQEISGTEPVAVSALVGGLSGATLYHYRAVAVGGGSTVYGDDLSFTTMAEAPVAATGSPADVSTSGATLVGVVNPNGLPAQVRFEYGQTTLFGSTTPVQNLPAGVQLVDVLAPLTGLIADRSYHYRIVATTSAGTTRGEPISFVAKDGPSPPAKPTAAPAVTTGGVSTVTATSANLLGTANPNEGTTVVRFEFGTTESYGRTTAQPGIGNGKDPVAISLPAHDLLPGTTYHYRLTATNSLGTTPGADKDFTTPYLAPEVVTGDVNAISTTSARVAGTVRAHHAAADVFFFYGTNPGSLDESVRATPATISGDATTEVSAQLPNLIQGNIYYYQVWAKNDGGTCEGAVRSFAVGVVSDLQQLFPDEITDDEHAGSVTVQLTPGGIGGGWRFAGEPQWRVSGSSATGLTSGYREIEYRPVPGYQQAPNETLLVISGSAPVVLNRAYAASAGTGSGGLIVTLKPAFLAEASVPEAGRAQWRLFGESDAQWKDGAAVLTGLTPGEYLIECKPVAGRTTPPPVTAKVTDGSPTVATITYFLAGGVVGTAPGVLSFETVSSRQDRPYAYVGQISSDVGMSTGFVVRPRVVATAGHVVFDDGTLAATTGLQWFFQRDRGVHEPAALTPRGYYLMSGYAARRALDNSPGTSTPESQNLDAASLYFLEDAGRGGFSGYLASDSTVNQFVTSSALKTLVGYPVDGITIGNQGRLHATPVANVTFASAFGQTYTTSGISTSGGSSGGPLCVQAQNGVYYPAAIYLGGTAQTVVRAIDGKVVDLFGFAEVSAYAGVGGTGGRLTQSGTSTIDPPTTLGAIEVRIEPETARAAGAGWRVQATGAYSASGAQIDGLSPNSYTVQFAEVSGFMPPASQPVVIQGGQLTSITFTYEEIIYPPIITSPNTVTGTRGQPLAYQITATHFPGFFTQLGTLPLGMTFNADNGLISGTPQEAGNFPVTIGASGAGGSDSRVVNLTVRPALAAQSVTVPYEQPMSYQIASSGNGAGVSFYATNLPAGLALDAATGWITGTPTIPGLYTVPVTVTRKGASATANLTLAITGTVPEFTLQPVPNKSIEYGLNTTLIVAASGLPAPTFQWYEGDSGDTTSLVKGATSATFTTPILTKDNTSYWVRANSISGSADSTATVISLLKSTNANLANLSMSAGSLSPAFNAAILSYLASVPYTSSSITLTPKVQIGQSTVTINGDDAISGVASAPFNLAVGTNAFVIEVTAGASTVDNPIKKTYRVTITRAEAPPPPVATTDPATDITDISATLNGTVIPNSAVAVRFEYGSTSAYGSTTPWQNVSGTTPRQIQAALSGLSSDEDYHYRIVVSSVVGLRHGDDMPFTTGPERPLAATGSPAGVSPTGATLIGAVNPKGFATTAYFEYGMNELYDRVAPYPLPNRNIPAGTNVVDVIANISGLTPGATYHYRIVATSEAGTRKGEAVSFVAISGGGSGDGVVDKPPTVITWSVSDVTTTSASLKGTVNPNEGTTFVYFKYGPTNAYGSTTVSLGIGNGNQPADVAIPITGLLPGTEYYYLLMASNSLGMTEGKEATFTAGHLPPFATTGTAAALTATSATVNGSVRARGDIAEVWFDYGTDGVNFPSSIRAFPPHVTGDQETPVNVDLLNLNSVVTYYYKVRAVSSGGNQSGDVATFQVGALRGLVQDFTQEVPLVDRQGQVLVNIQPSGIGGWRFVGESKWRLPGVAVTGLTTADREIEYQPVPGYIQPLGEIVSTSEAPVVIDRYYFEAGAEGYGVLRVLLEPEAMAAPSVPVSSRAQWRLVAGGNTTWRNSGDEMTGLMSGSYLVECKAVSGKSTPPPINVLVTNGETTTAAITYFPAAAPSLNPPVVVPFTTTSTNRNLPHAYVGQIRSGTGLYSGFAVKPRVVATAAQAVFDEATLAATSGTQWLLQRDNGNYEPDPQVPRGFYSFDGYAAQRAVEDTPGDLSLESQNINVAALYFAEDAGRGGFSGFLTSDEGTNPYLESAALKTLIGYPVSGISSGNQGRMHATPPVNSAFNWALGRTYTCAGIRGVGGMTGGPLCVQRDGGTYYPAGIYVGGINHGIVRAIDGGVVDLFTRAEVSSNGGDNNTGGGITHTSFTSLGSTTAGGISVTIEPEAARNAGAGWRLMPESLETDYRLSGKQKTGLIPGTYVLEFRPVSGFPSLSQPSVAVIGGKLTAITFTYGQTLTALESWRLAHFGTTKDEGDAADNADPDGDGNLNRSEYAADTNPKDAKDVLKMLTMEKSTAGFTVTVKGKAGRRYALQRSVSLAGGSWENVLSIGPLPANQSSLTLTDPNPPSSTGFYRIEVSVPEVSAP